MQKICIVLGVILIFIGLLWPWIMRLGIGHLPGDIIIKRDNFTLYFPLATSIILSILISIIWYLLRK